MSRSKIGVDPTPHEHRPSPESSSETLLLMERWVDGDERAIDDLLPRVYGELRKLAGKYLRSERPDHTLTPTGLVHEAYMRLLGEDIAGANVQNRVHFFAVVARAMRRILVERARRYLAARRASPKDRVAIEDEAIWARVDPPPTEILDLDQTLDRLRKVSPRQADVVEMRYFGGLSESDIARVLGVSRATIARDWRMARIYLARNLSAEKAAQAKQESAE